MKDIDVIYKGEVLKLTRFWGNNKLCLWIKNSKVFSNVGKSSAIITSFFIRPPIFLNCYCELLPLIEVGASWEVCAFVSHIYLPSSLDSPYPDIFFNLLFLLLIFLNLFLIYLYLHYNLYLFLVHNIRNDIFFLIILEFLLYFHS